MKTRPTSSRLFRAAWLALALGAPSLPGSGPSAEPGNSGLSIWTQNVTADRKKLGQIGRYTKRWDLGDLPRYAPSRQVSGVLRVWGNNYIGDGDLGRYWKEGFAKFQPGIRIEYHLPTSGIGIPALCCGVSDVSMSRHSTIMDLLTFEQVFHHPITEIPAVTGSYDVQGWDPAFIIVVNKDNPLDRISMKQLDGVFGAERRGGYVDSVWHTEYPYSRGPEENIRTWGQLGLTGEWADKPIHAGGQGMRGHATSVFSDFVLRSSDQWVEGYKAYQNYVATGGRIYSWSKQVRRAVAADKYALYWVYPAALAPGMKELAVQAYGGGPYVKRSPDSIRDHAYPLASYMYFYLNRDPGKPVDPKVDEFLHYILSREGQEEVQREGRYIPLTAEAVREGLRKLE